MRTEKFQRILNASRELSEELDALMKDPWKEESEVYLNPGLKKHLEELLEAVQQLRQVLICDRD